MKNCLRLQSGRRWRLWAAWIVLSIFGGGSAWGVEHRVEPLAEGPPAGTVSEAIAGKLADKGMRVIRGANRTVCDIWLCKEFAAKADFKPSLTVQYPLEPGTLVGVIRYHSRGGDFRDQRIAAGVYTMRFALQPVDGNHVGTSDTRDFLLLVSAERDQSEQPMTEMDLTAASADSIESTHPAMLALKAPGVAGGEGLPALVYDEMGDLWILVCEGQGTNGNGKKIRLGLVVVGHTMEL